MIKKIILILSIVTLFISCNNNASEIAVESVSLNKSKIILSKGQKSTIIATINPENASNKEIIWKSSDPGVVMVSEDGEIAAFNRGTANIIVTTKDGNKTVSCIVVIK